MEKSFITITEICEGYKLERTYVTSIGEFGLIQFYEDDREPQLNTTDLPKFEKIVRFHRDLNINFEGIEVILSLLERMEDMQQDLRRADSRLRIYEETIIKK